MIKIFRVEGMSCQHCVNEIKKQFERAGIRNFKIQIGLIEVDISDNTNDSELVKSLIEDAGYKVINE